MLDANVFDENLLNSLWNNADWQKIECTLFSMQRYIALAAKASDFNAVSMYQKSLTQSTEAKMLAVRHVISNEGTPGIDGVQWRKPSEYMKAALSLESAGYRASPTKLVIH